MRQKSSLQTETSFALSTSSCSKYRPPQADHRSVFPKTMSDGARNAVQTLSPCLPEALNKLPLNPAVRIVNCHKCASRARREMRALEHASQVTQQHLNYHRIFRFFTGTFSTVSECLVYFQISSEQLIAHQSRPSSISPHIPHENRLTSCRRSRRSTISENSSRKIPGGPECNSGLPQETGNRKQTVRTCEHSQKNQLSTALNPL